MTETSNQSEERDYARAEYKTFGDIVWGQFKKYPVSYYSLYGVLLLFLIAILTPAFALDVPFYISVPAGVGPAHLEGTHFPWFLSLFDQNFMESGLDIFFNALLFYTPLAVLGYVVAMRNLAFEDTRARKVFKSKYILGVVAAFVGLFVVIYISEFRQPFVDWIGIADMDGVKSIFPPLEYSYREPNMAATQQDPSWAHWIGTDREGRDVFTRILYGTRISLTIGVVAVAIYTTIGLILGGLAGYFGGRVDMAVMRLIEVMICFPTFFLILTLRGFVDDPSIFHIMLIIGVTGWTRIARLVRAEFLRLKNQDFVQAAIALGLPETRIIFKHLMPNALGPVFVAATFGVAGAILIEASLSFLGLGPATAPSWGQILTAGREISKPAIILAPGFAIFVTVSLLNLVGEGMRDALDPKLRK